ncbi:hypothetical protein CMEL01_15991 [Colletotrichum melonis]|uniref:C2H2-type domain-containing protein n=1 Tax=Colletotrichum melonis TaxID=1209925 RepID=A0AAI9XNS0_9PEZI|nr:hypothetical protein CMEL01_15991 [Colletotrichum melonis]
MPWQRDMRKHHGTHFKRPRYQCRCERSYTKMDNLNKHIKNSKTASQKVQSRCMRSKP